MRAFAWVSLISRQTISLICRYEGAKRMTRASLRVAIHQRARIATAFDLPHLWPDRTVTRLYFAAARRISACFDQTRMPSTSRAKATGSSRYF